MSNPLLGELYSENLSTDEWLVDMDLLRKLEKHATNPEFQSKWQAIKLINKRRFVTWMKSQVEDVEID